MFSLTLQPSHRLAIFIAETRPTYPNFSHFEVSISCTESPVKNPVLISTPYPKLYNPKAMLFTAADIGVPPVPSFERFPSQSLFISYIPGGQDYSTGIVTTIF